MEKTSKEFICNCFGIDDATCNYIDNLRRNFDVNFDYDDLLEVANSWLDSMPNIGGGVIYGLFNRIIENACEQFNSYEDLEVCFDWECNFENSYLRFNNIEYTNKEELYKAIEEYLATDKE